MISTYSVIVALSVVVALNPLTYGLLFPTDDWWMSRLTLLSLLLLDSYLGLIAVVGMLCVRFTKWSWFLTLIALLLFLFPFLVGSEIALAYYRMVVSNKNPIDKRQSGLYLADPELGWVPRAETVITESFSRGVEVSYVIDAERRKAIPMAESAARHFYFFGDSFVFGTGVPNRDTALNLLAKRIGEDVAVLQLRGFRLWPRTDVWPPSEAYRSDPAR